MEPIDTLGTTECLLRAARFPCLGSTSVHSCDTADAAKCLWCGLHMLRRRKLNAGAHQWHQGGGGRETEEYSRCVPWPRPTVNFLHCTSWRRHHHLLRKKCVPGASLVCPHRMRAGANPNGNVALVCAWNYATSIMCTIFFFFSAISHSFVLFRFFLFFLRFSFNFLYFNFLIFSYFLISSFFVFFSFCLICFSSLFSSSFSPFVLSFFFLCLSFVVFP